MAAIINGGTLRPTRDFGALVPIITSTAMNVLASGSFSEKTSASTPAFIPSLSHENQQPHKLLHMSRQSLVVSRQVRL